MNDQERGIVKGLVQVIWADGTVDDHERELLGGLLASMGLSHEEIGEVGTMMVEAPEMPDLTQSFPDEESRRGVMTLLLEMANADGHIGEAEQRVLLSMARHLGISREEFAEMTSVVQASGPSA